MRSRERYRFYSYGDACLLSSARRCHERVRLRPFARRRTAPRGADAHDRRTARSRTPAFMPVGTAATVKAMTAGRGARDRAPTSCSPTPIT